MTIALFFSTPDTPGAFALSADSGLFSLTGRTAAVRVGRRVVAGASSFALLVFSIVLHPGRYILAAAGGFNLTGANAALTYTTHSVAHLTMSASMGSFSLTEMAALLRYSGAGAWTEIPITPETWTRVSD